MIDLDANIEDDEIDVAVVGSVQAMWIEVERVGGSVDAVKEGLLAAL